MPKHAHKAIHDAQTHRREVVAQLRIRGYSIRKIVSLLPGQGIVNPETGRGYTTETVFQDLHALDEQWHQNALETIAKGKERELAKLDEVEHVCWANNKMRDVLMCMERRAKMMGFDAPTRSLNLTAEELANLSDDDLNRLLDAASR